MQVHACASHSPSLRALCAMRFVLLLALVAALQGPRVFSKPICVPGSLVEGTSVQETFNPDTIGSGVILSINCTLLMEPTITVAVEESLQTVIEWPNTTDERIAFGYVCAGNVSFNFTTTLPRSKPWKSFPVHRANSQSLSTGDECIFFGCYWYLHEARYIKEGDKIKRIPGRIVGEALNSSSCIIDKDECSEEVTLCEHTCTNTVGSYSCTCKEGYFLHTDGHSCIDIDECDAGLHNCAHTCTTKSDGGYLCSCNDGYVLSEDGHSCDDVDECSLNTTACTHNCTNTNGSYGCACLDGYQLEADQHNCTETIQHWAQVHLSISILKWIILIGILILALLVLCCLALILLRKHKRNKHGNMKKMMLMFKCQFKNEEVDPTYVPGNILSTKTVTQSQNHTTHEDHVLIKVSSESSDAVSEKSQDGCPIVSSMSTCRKTNSVSFCSQVRGLSDPIDSHSVPNEITAKTKIRGEENETSFFIRATSSSISCGFEDKKDAAYSTPSPLKPLVIRDCTKSTDLSPSSSITTTDSVGLSAVQDAPPPEFCFEKTYPPNLLDSHSCALSSSSASESSTGLSHTYRTHFTASGYMTETSDATHSFHPPLLQCTSTSECSDTSYTHNNTCSLTKSI